jgi:glycosyltransferase involved in cell wall biosynthesis
MRIAIVSELFPPFVVGGAEVSSMYLAEALARDNDVLVVTPNYGKRTEIDTKGRLTVHRFGFPGILRKGQLSVRVMANPLMALVLSRKIKKVLDDFRPDVIHAQNSLSFFPIALINTKAKKVATLRDYSSLCDCGFCSLKRKFERHGLLEYVRLKYRWQPSAARILAYPLDYLILKMKQYSLKRMDGVICVSGFVREVYSGLARKSVAIHNIGKFETIKRDRTGGMVLYVGKVSVGKGTDVFLETIGIVSKHNKSASFVIAGDGPLRERVAEFAKSYGNVKYLGKVPHEKVLELYSRAAVVCSTSVWAEPLSRVPIEALSLGVPCVATDVGGTAEIIDDGVNGFLVEPGKPEQMAERIEALLSDKKLREKFSRNGIEKIRKSFDEHKIVKEHVAFYREFL